MLIWKYNVPNIQGNKEGSPSLPLPTHPPFSGLAAVSKAFKTGAMMLL